MTSRSPSWRLVEIESGLASKHPNTSQSIPVLRHLLFRIRLLKSLKWKLELRHWTVYRLPLECPSGSNNQGATGLPSARLTLTGIIRISYGIDGDEGQTKIKTGKKGC